MQNIKISRKHVNTAIGFYFLIVISLFLLFPSKTLYLYWYAFGLGAMLFFFLNLFYLSKRWQHLSQTLYEKKLFWFAFFVRVVYVFLSYGFFYLMNNEPFEFSAGDSKGYHGEALWIVDLLQRNHLDNYIRYLGGGFSDAGYPVFLSLFNFFGETILIPRLVHAWLGAKTAVLAMHLATRNFNQKTGRLAGLLVALMPSLIYYTGLHLKETLMIYFLMLFLNKGDLMIRQRVFNPKKVMTVLFTGLILFFFRTVLGVAALFSLGTALIFSDRRLSSLSYRFKAALVTGVVGLLFVVSFFSKEIGFYYEHSDSNLNDQMEHYANRTDGNKLAKYGKASLFVPVILIVPLPTIVDTKQQNQFMIHGAVLIKNIMAFFVLFALFKFWRQKRMRQHILLLSFMLAYLGILVNSAFAFSERFHLVIIPVFLVLAAEGIRQYRWRIQTFQIYLTFLFVLIIGWNWFKLAGRA